MGSTVAGVPPCQVATENVVDGVRVHCEAHPPHTGPELMSMAYVQAGHRPRFRKEACPTTQPGRNRAL